MRFFGSTYVFGRSMRFFGSTYVFGRSMRFFFRIFKTRYCNVEYTSMGP